MAMVMGNTTTVLLRLAKMILLGFPLGLKKAALRFPPVWVGTRDVPIGRGHGRDAWRACRGILLLSCGVIWCFHSPHPEVKSEQGRSQP